MIGKTLGRRYRIDALIGSGGMAVVYRATDLRSKRVVAIKLLKEQYSQNADFLSRFDREAMASAKVRHANIVSLLDIGDEGGLRYLVIEYVKGMTLKDLIRERGRLTPDEAIKITLYILAALEHAHDKGIIHRDIKPQNVLVDDAGHIKIADFGIAKMADASTLTQNDNSVMGSVHYFSPEQARGKPAGISSDLYSTGVVLYEMLTGRVPFEGENAYDVARQHIESTPKAPSVYAPDIPIALEEILTKALCKDLSQRYSSAAQMSADLRKARRNPQGGFVIMRPTEQIESQPETGGQRPVPRPKRRRKRRKSFVVVTVLVCLAVLALLAWGGYRIVYEALTYTTMPDLIAMEEAAALRTLERSGLSGQGGVNTSILRDRSELPMGQVFEQIPESGERVRRDQFITLYVSQGTGLLTVPDVLGLPLEKAEEALAAAGLSPGDIVTDLSEMAPGLVFHQIPESGEQVEGNTVVDLHISGGLVIVPDLKTLSRTQAETQLTSLGLTLGRVSYMAVDEPEKDGLVQSQYPAMGTRVYPGTDIDLSVAKADTRPYKSEVTLTMKIPVGGAHVRVTLVDLQGEESDQYAAMVAQDGEYDLKVTLRSAQVGEMQYRLYIDGQLREEQPVTLR